MTDRLSRPEGGSSKRDVSPLGASKFERPYSPPTGRVSTNTTPSLDQPRHLSEPSQPTPRTSTTTSHTSPSIPEAAPPHFSKRSLVSTVPTTYSSSAHTSVDRFEQALDEISNSSCPLPADRNAWFTKQLDEDDMDIPVESDECPDGATLAAVQDMLIYDEEGNAHPFGSLYDPEKTTNERQLIIFIRHFFCGACQAFVNAITESITASDYERIPIPTSIIIISCGKPDLIQHYRKFPGCNTRFPIFAEPTRKLFKTLGMKWSASLGDRPEYMRDISIMDVVKGNVRDIGAGLREEGGLRKRDMLRGGNLLQIGGEFLFENGSVIWCHRMRHMRGRKSLSKNPFLMFFR